MAEEPRKRSRFDQTEPKKPSRFDRRSKSPPSRATAERSRSPLPSRSPSSATDNKDPAAAAAAAAARINAQIQARKADLPPPPPVLAAPKKSTTAQGVTSEIYCQDGDYIKDIEINDLRNRYTLTKGGTQKMIKDETGADITTRGEYYPDKSMATPSAPPLHLHVTSTSKEGLELAIIKINEMMQQELPNLVDERRFRRREPEPFERDEFGRRKWPEEKIPIDLEPIPGFNLRAQVVGSGGAYVKHIQGETRCRVQIKGRGSGFKDQATQQEHDEPMYLHVAGPDADMVKRAKELCIDLLENVKTEYEKFKERGPQNRGNFNGDRYDGRNSNRQDSYGGGGGGGGDRGGYNNGGGYQGGYGGAQSPSTPAGGDATGAQSPTAAGDYAAQYAQYYGANGQADPYAAYGGYQNYVAMYYQYYQQQAPPPPSEAPPPPPPGGSAPPPPPPGAPPGTSGGYSAVPPPPGL
ncbi:hypothetical protein BT63DRAFT_71084 [Microthyrium microscopicum]|uniref:K Homology domain-containing protein n=1 Tax=Microthyrium microscopicum TaxID=703497 RepID=A0A6A6U230_9PEZI|nr:hypothetical protein BT63DRAFT_71084 [Microthyrium microscopicum]